MSPPPTPWLVPAPEKKPARLRLLCLPYAGAGAGAFRGWEEALPPDVHLCRVQLPGRETRFTEPALADVDAVVPPLAEALLPWLDRPFVILGHSMGAMLGFELARRLRERHGLEPAALYPSAHRAPHLPHPRPPVAHLEDARFVQELRWMKGTPEEVFANPELLELVLPTLRADVALWEGYRHRPGPALSCPITVFGGEDDEVATPAELEPWREHTTAAFALHLLPGDHFFVHTCREALLALLGRELGARLAELDS